MIRPPPGSTLSDTLFPYTTRFRSKARCPSTARFFRKGGLGHGLVRTVDFPRRSHPVDRREHRARDRRRAPATRLRRRRPGSDGRDSSEETTSELQSIRRSSTADFCMKKKKNQQI